MSYNNTKQYYKQRNGDRKYSSSSSDSSQSSSSSSSKISSSSSQSLESSKVESSQISQSISEKAHFKFRIGDKIKKYKIKGHLSDGTFGRVLKVKRNSKYYAMKVIRRGHTSSARQEAKILHYLNKDDPSHYFVRLYDNLYYNMHYCMVFEQLGPTLQQFLALHKGQGIHLKYLQSFTYQILKMVDFLHKKNYTHTDLKPDNIVFRYQNKLKKKFKEDDCIYYIPEKVRLVLIDFGGATHDSESHDCMINSRQYRAPEVQLQCCEWEKISDVWSIGCIIAELYKGSLLFQTRKNEFEHIALMQKVTGKRIPDYMADNVQGSLQPYFSDGRYIWPQLSQTTRESFEKVFNYPTLREMITHPQLYDLLKDMLELDPNKRITCSQALSYEFITMKI